MAWANIRFAKIKGELTPELIEKIFEGIKEYGLRNRKPTRKGFIQLEKKKEGIFFKFYKDIQKTTQILNDSNSQLLDEKYPSCELKSIFIFNEGFISYEKPIRGKSTSSEILNLIKESINNQIEIEQINQFPYKSLKIFFESAKEINYIKLTDIGKTKPNPHWPKEWMKEMVEDLGKDAEIVDVSTGRKKKDENKNLKRPEVIREGLMPISKPTYIRGKLEDNNTFSITIYGYLGTSLPEKDENLRISKFIKVCKKVIDGFLK